MYKQIKELFTDRIECIKRLPDNAFIPFDPANTDYQTFKSQINADEAQLQDADGNTMSAEDAKQFVASLP